MAVALGAAAGRGDQRRMEALGVFLGERGMDRREPRFARSDRAAPSYRPTVRAS
jgi:hypothetical protein